MKINKGFKSIIAPSNCSSIRCYRRCKLQQQILFLLFLSLHVYFCISLWRALKSIDIINCSGIKLQSSLHFYIYKHRNILILVLKGTTNFPTSRLVVLLTHIYKEIRKHYKGVEWLNYDVGYLWSNTLASGIFVWYGKYVHWWHTAFYACVSSIGEKLAFKPCLLEMLLCCVKDRFLF